MAINSPNPLDLDRAHWTRAFVGPHLSEVQKDASPLNVTGPAMRKFEFGCILLTYLVETMALIVKLIALICS